MQAFAPNSSSNPDRLIRTGMSHLNYEQLKQVTRRAEQHFGKLKERHPRIKAYLVFSLPGYQTGVRSAGREILKSVPGMVIDNPAKAAVKKHLKTKPGKDAKKSEIKAWEDEFETLESMLSYSMEARVELRFNQLDYKLIGELQQDPLVDRDLTPQTPASIRIALGSVGGFFVGEK